MLEFASWRDATERTVMAHSQTKVKAFFSEFPFLKNYTTEERVNEVKVSRINADFLTKRCQRVTMDIWAGPLMPQPKWSEKIFLLSESGKWLRQVEYQMMCRNPNYHWYRWWNRREPKWLGISSDSRLSMEHALKLMKTRPSESIGDTLNSLRNPNEVYYVLCITPLVENPTNWNVTIYKPPKDFTLKEWVLEQQRRVGEEIKELISKIGTEINQ
ncbi:hypothetical protein A3C91_02890 [Candidatus Azambacteria bacterium RIFCSPHIGHO2_02_FULL_52_12]|uniref:Uncharacterized protein n=1 Tax=Candidatus Azambacteria bacterium RIFCSPLOWO2_01_FULL_46_25 TaxID=1797298 RepID=A0A1F5BTC6_9BACT|nr:MAG: hypothetical protein A3C91_02890 [Candidatus Azambacteria bacterium RIFCSPHIGHO2_02_FULL_52_12]OGD33880.1 MAG: hypothetical protein A2988_00075 [Candidatus Azambacteria bacterium RIFCSPLOWO2_01_FULL_46_25]OGD36793.1 MAG: hypothetical protein A2850_02345 [Candidatus Azambacteria bacterium RIFCSPHIGHO2_01_FULL_51_74]